MMTAAEMVHDLLAIAQLRDAEGRLREAGRAIELVPGRRGEANRLFELASRVRSERQELLDRCGLR